MSACVVVLAEIWPVNCSIARLTKCMFYTCVYMYRDKMYVYWCLTLVVISLVLFMLWNVLPLNYFFHQLYDDDVHDGRWHRSGIPTWALKRSNKFSSNLEGGRRNRRATERSNQRPVDWLFWDGLTNPSGRRIDGRSAQLSKWPKNTSSKAHCPTFFGMFFSPTLQSQTQTANQPNLSHLLRCELDGSACYCLTCKPRSVCNFEVWNLEVNTIFYFWNIAM